MLEIASLLFGGLLRLAPSVLEYFDAKNKRQHEREMFALEMEKAKVVSELRQQEAEVKALGDASAAATKPCYRPTGNRWADVVLACIEAFSATVRPVLTYWFCVAMYGAYKTAVFVNMQDIGLTWKDAVIALWTPTDYAIMLSIISFWFVDRSLRKLRDK